MGKDRKRKARKRQKLVRPSKAGNARPQAGEARDYHHVLYQRRHWAKPWTKRLREHPYMGKRIPMYTLHQGIHAKVHDIPVPHEDVCEATVRELERLRVAKAIDCQRDSLEARLGFLIGFWGEMEGMDATVAMLRWQRQIVRKFYQSSP